eukprot:gene24864-31253_t
MHKNILVIGGTRHVGKLLVQKLLDAGHRVTLATRGRTADSFGDRVQRVRVDRRDKWIRPTRCLSNSTRKPCGPW